MQKQIHLEIKRAFEVTRALGGEFDLKFEIGSPPMLNHPETSDLLASVASDLLGKNKVLPFIKELGAEDFGCYLDIIPGAMFSLGAKVPGTAIPLHSPLFDIDENCLPVGTAIFFETARRYLDKESKII